MVKGVRAFLDYLSGADVQEKWHKKTGYVPVLATLPKKLEAFYRDPPASSCGCCSDARKQNG